MTFRNIPGEGVQEQCPDGNRIWTECKSKKRHVAVTFWQILDESREGVQEQCAGGNRIWTECKKQKTACSRYILASSGRKP